MRKLVFLSILFVLFGFSVVVARASEGVTELRSTTGEPYRCIAESHQAQDRKYKVLVTCRDLIYPADSDVFAYVMWANPIKEGKIIKMGKLDFGKKLFEVGRAYSSIFVTTEEKPGVETPKGEIVMQGSVQSRLFLDGPTTPTPTPEEEVIEEETPEETMQQEEAKPSTRGRLSTGLRRASLIIVVILLIGAVAALFVILRSKKR